MLFITDMYCLADDKDSAIIFFNSFRARYSLSGFENWSDLNHYYYNFTIVSFSSYFSQRESYVVVIANCTRLTFAEDQQDLSPLSVSRHWQLPENALPKLVTTIVDDPHILLVHHFLIGSLLNLGQ